MRYLACQWLLLALSGFLLTSVAHAQKADTSRDARACISIESDSARLECYDRALGHRSPSKDRTRASAEVYTKAGSGKPSQASAHSRISSLLDSRWELAPDSKLGTFNIRGYKPVYLLPVFYTSDVNRTPSSPAPGHDATEPRELDSLETKFQLSLKSKIWEGIFGGRGDLWAGYTQSSHWQVYNSKASRPFRESDYEPEAMLMFNTDYEVFGWNGRLLGIGINHQSNGQSDPFSRSWNRVMLDIGLERDGWALMLRPWWRIPERASKDDNPDISDFMGRGDLLLVHEYKGHEFALMARHSLRGGDRSHGALQFDWAFPIDDNLRGHMQIFDGYGESLIDYNHRALYFGLGISLVEWY